MKIRTSNLISLIFFAFLLSGSAFALTLDEAREKNAVKELPNGYIEAVDASAKSLADEINTKRKKAYQEIAQKNGLKIEDVAAQAAQKIKDKLNK